MLSNIRWSTLAWMAALGTLSPTLRAEPAKAAAPRAGATNPAPARPAAAQSELTPAQRQQVDALRAKTESQLTPLREQLSSKRKELDGLWSAEAPNRAAILKADSELDALRQKMRQIGIEHRLAYLALLTPEQRVAWKQRHAAGMGRGPGMGHGGMGAGPGGGMGRGSMHGRMGPGGMGMSDDCMGMDECSNCMDCGGTEACSGPGPNAPAPAAPPAPATRPSTPPR